MSVADEVLRLLAPAMQRELDLASTDPIGHLDEAWDIACEYQPAPDRRCGEHASWWLLCRGCGTSIAHCHAHQLAQRLTWARHGHDASVTCNACHRAVLAAAWTDLFRFTPIEGRP